MSSVSAAKSVSVCPEGYSPKATAVADSMVRSYPLDSIWVGSKGVRQELGHGGRSRHSRDLSRGAVRDESKVGLVEDSCSVKLGQGRPV